MSKRIAVVTGGMGGPDEAISTKLHDAGFVTGANLAINGGQHMQ